MKKSVLFICFFLGHLVVANAQSSREMAMVISSTPNIVKSYSLQRVCDSVATNQQASGFNAGSLIGGIAGALLGSQVGGGNGRIAAAAIGGATGAIAGDRINSNSGNSSVECRTESVPVQQINGYLIEYEYHGQKFTTISSRPYAVGPANVVVNVSLQ